MESIDVWRQIIWFFWCRQTFKLELVKTQREPELLAAEIFNFFKFEIIRKLDWTGVEQLQELLNDSDAKIKFNLLCQLPLSLDGDRITRNPIKII